MLHFLRTLLLSITLLYAASDSCANNIEIEFLSQRLSLPVWELPQNNAQLHQAQKKKQFKVIHDVLSSTHFSSLKDSLTMHQQQLTLNDWLLYQIIDDYATQLSQRWDKKFPKEILNWFILNQLNKDARIGWNNNKFVLFVKINEEIFEAPIIAEEGQNFINLNALQKRNRKKKSKQEAVYLANFSPNPQGEYFSFALSVLPSIPSKVIEKNIVFSYKNQQYKIAFNTDSNIPLLLKNYPLLNEKIYFTVPFSPITKQSLLKELNIILAGFSEEEKLAFLATLSRSAFQYKEDGEFFGFSKPMVADELFFYPYSDCEDRSALFFNLVKELLDFPQVVVAFSDHISIAVAFPSKQGKPILHNGKKYYICDPTGPSNNSEIGNFPSEYKNKPYSILLESE